MVLCEDTPQPDRSIPSIAEVRESKPDTLLSSSGTKSAQAAGAAALRVTLGSTRSTTKVRGGHTSLCPNTQKAEAENEKSRVILG